MKIGDIPIRPSPMKPHTACALGELENGLLNGCRTVDVADCRKGLANFKVHCMSLCAEGLVGLCHVQQRRLVVSEDPQMAGIESRGHGALLQGKPTLPGPTDDTRGRLGPMREEHRVRIQPVRRLFTAERGVLQEQNLQTSSSFGNARKNLSAAREGQKSPDSKTTRIHQIPRFQRSLL